MYILLNILQLKTNKINVLYLIYIIQVPIVKFRPMESMKLVEFNISRISRNL